MEPSNRRRLKSLAGFDQFANSGSRSKICYDCPVAKAETVTEGEINLRGGVSADSPGSRGATETAPSAVKGDYPLLELAFAEYDWQPLRNYYQERALFGSYYEEINKHSELIEKVSNGAISRLQFEDYLVNFLSSRDKQNRSGSPMLFTLHQRAQSFEQLQIQLILLIRNVANPNAFGQDQKPLTDFWGRLSNQLISEVQRSLAKVDAGGETALISFSDSFVELAASTAQRRGRIKTGLEYQQALKQGRQLLGDENCFVNKLSSDSSEENQLGHYAFGPDNAYRMRVKAAESLVRKIDDELIRHLNRTGFRVRSSLGLHQRKNFAGWKDKQVPFPEMSLATALRGYYGAAWVNALIATPSAGAAGCVFNDFRSKSEVVQRQLDDYSKQLVEIEYSRRTEIKSDQRRARLRPLEQIKVPSLHAFRQADRRLRNGG